ncbi:MAG: translation initiation factor IF-2 [Alphaproteobacteria bacterium]
MDSTEKEKTTRKPLKVSRPGRLELRKTVESGQVKQSFSHGRSKTVTVEVKRKRTFTAGAGGRMTEVKTPPAPEPEPIQPETTVEAAEVELETPTPKRTLTDQERAARIRALEDAKRAAEEAAKEQEAEEAREALRIGREVAERAEEEERRRVEDERTRRRVEEEARAKTESESRRLAEEAAQRAADTERRRREGEPTPAEGAAEEQPEARAKKPQKAAPARGTRPRGERRRTGKLTISQALDEESGERRRSVAALRRRQERERQRAHGQPLQAQPARKVLREVVIPDTITVGELANRMAERSAEVIKALMKMDVMATINQSIDQDTAELVVEEFGHSVKRVSAADVEIGVGGEPDEDTALHPRAPVVTVMGHVDHGKTSLLDALRETDVVSREAGGITQHIGAYQVGLESGARITFIDTPGHEAFTAMRQRGAQVTDIVILVVAADDGVQPQTIEAINHARAADVPIVVALNKIDRPQADPQRIRNELLKHEIITEDLGGEIQCVEVSATEKTNLDKLEEAVLLQSEILELKANPNRPAFGAVVEAKLERGRGPVATLLVEKGTLKVGDVFVAGGEWGRVRALLDDHQNPVESAGPSVPVEVLGLNGTPQAGDEFAVVENEARAREITDYRQQQLRDQRTTTRGSLEQIFGKISAGEKAEVPIVIKADVQGSAEAIADAIEKLGTEEVRAQVLHSGVGGITESDISLAAASGGVVIGFNVRANPQARDQAKRTDVEIRYHSIIYNVVDDVKKLLEGRLAPAIEETHLGSADIREIFNISKVGQVAGCLVTDGVMRRGSKARLLRDSVVVHEGDVGTLRRFKEDVREVRDGYECGVALENYQDIRTGDVIECYEVKEVARQL